MIKNKKKPEVKKLEFNEILIEAGRTGATTKIFVDGAQLGNCISATFQADANSLNTLTLKLVPKSVIIKGEAGIKEI